VFIVRNGRKGKEREFFLKMGAGGKGAGGVVALFPFCFFFSTFQLYGIEALFGFNPQINF